MAVTGGEIQVHYRYTYLGQKCENVQSYAVQGAAALTVDLIDILEALWNDQKDRLRAIMTNYIVEASWDSLLGYEVGGGLALAEFAVPPDERVGTRSTSGLGTAVMSFAAGGFRQTVGTRVTRPGQKRFPFLFEADILANGLEAGYLALLEDIAVAFTAPIALGAPALAVALQPIVVHEPTVDAPARATQFITGYVVNQDITSQISRKKGRGA